MDSLPMRQTREILGWTWLARAHQRDLAHSPGVSAVRSGATRAAGQRGGY